MFPFCVRKHRAPKGALRPVNGNFDGSFFGVVRKHRAPKGALRLVGFHSRNSFVKYVRKHRAPKGALRLQRLSLISGSHLTFVRKHRAPKGALRHPDRGQRRRRLQLVRKHRAPKGALRPEQQTVVYQTPDERQKAPSAKRCIKTNLKNWREQFACHLSESTERQKVH